METKINIEERDLPKLKQYFKQQIIAIPELQRNFVWNVTRARDLADSIYKGYPIGTFTIWDASKTTENLLRHAKGLLPPYESQNNDRIHYVIDGQQRLTVLYSFLNPEGVQITNDKGQSFNSYNICFSIRKNEDGLNFVYSKKGPDNKRYFSLCKILDDNSQKNILAFIKSKHAKEKIKECRRRFFSYNFGFAYINSDVKENSFKETFIRLNTRGLSLSAVDRAYTYASDIRLREYIKKIKERLGESFKDISDKPIHEAIYLIYGGKQFTGKAIDIIIKKINDKKEQREEFEKRKWKKIAHAVEDAINFLKKQGVISSEYLPSNTMLPILTAYFYHKKSRKNNKIINKQFKKWFWYSAISGRYSGRGYTTNVRKDSLVMKSLAEGKYQEFDEVRKIPLSELDNCSYYASRSSLARAFYCLLALQNPKEFTDSQITIDLSNPTYRHRKQNHHIFPEDLMHNIVPHKKYNSIINICFLPQKINASFNKEQPSVYLKSDILDKSNLDKILKSHLIPTIVKKEDKDLKKLFNKFYEQRKREIARKFENLAGGVKLFE